MIAFHTFTGVLALLSGLGVIFLEKGSWRHRWVGRIYGIAMLLLCLTSFFIYRLFGRFGPFHVTAIVSGISVAGGMIPVWLRHRFPKWLQYHYRFMLFSYVGLLMATGSHFFGGAINALASWGWSRGASVVLCALLFWVVPYIIGTVLINRHWPAFRERFGHPQSANK